MNILAITGAALAVYFVLVWFLGTVLGLKGSDLWILRGGLALIGIIVAGAYYWYRMKSLAALVPSKGTQDTGAGQSSSDIDVLVREAESRLASSELGRKATLAGMPVFLIVGREGSAKTSAIVQSGLDPELLAGNVFQESLVAPT